MPLRIGCVLLLLLCASASAQNTTTMVGTLADSFGNGNTAKLGATCSFRSGALLTTANGWLVTGAAHAVPVVNGALSVDLVPTDTARPAGYHEMRCHVPLQTADGRNCEGNAALVSQGLCTVGPLDLGPVYVDVPTSGSPVQLKDHLTVAKPPAAPLTVRISQLDASAIAEGTGGCLQKNGGVLVFTTTCPGGTGSSGSGISSTATFAQMKAGTASGGSVISTTTFAQMKTQ